MQAKFNSMKWPFLNKNVLSVTGVLLYQACLYFKYSHVSIVIIMRNKAGMGGLKPHRYMTRNNV